jgi:hypothetical protein
MFTVWTGTAYQITIKFFDKRKFLARWTWVLDLVQSAFQELSLLFQNTGSIFSVSLFFIFR